MITYQLVAGVSVASGVQTVSGITDDQLHACAQIVLQVGGPLCN